MPSGGKKASEVCRGGAGVIAVRTGLVVGNVTERRTSGGGVKVENVMKQKQPISTLLADNTRGLITTKQTKPRPSLFCPLTARKRRPLVVGSNKEGHRSTGSDIGTC